LNKRLIGPQSGSAYFGEEKLKTRVKVKVKVKFTLEQTTKAQRGSRGVTLFL